MKVKCPKCGKEGTLTRRLTISNNKRYFYLYVQHVQTVEGKTKRVWHYYGKIEDVKESIHKNDQNYTQTITQNGEAQKKFKSKNRTEFNGVSPGSIARSSIGGCRPPDPGSNPGQGAKFSQ